MKNLLIINQHTCNHGDEAAGKAFLRQIFNNAKDIDVGILYNTKASHETGFIKVDQEVKHHEYNALNLIDKILIRLTFLIPFSLVKYFLLFGKVTKSEFSLIQSYEKIVNAPGGVNIGPYKDWRYLWRLYVALKLQKNTAIYSISFGPLPKNIIFSYFSKKVLRNVEFLSLRDSKSQSYARNLGIEHVPSIDTAFLNNHPREVSHSPVSKLLTNDYAIVVPNELYRWHVNYMNTPKSEFDDLYREVIEYFIGQDIDVVLLPQMFGTENDSDYFKYLKSTLRGEIDRVTVVPDEYSSDVQQEIVSRATFLVGARYHTIIFSIINGRPFFSLAYEHKMTNTLELLDLLDCNIAIDSLLSDKNRELLSALDRAYKSKISIERKVKGANGLAQKIALKVFDQFSKDFLDG